ncbi:hypothetical protein PanWU01x14_088810 [Parasponia andersonii]|uniref:Uncharacterized protein n=1 Tax=Parasponia andersonii TaxID=3476 RepID=A0A2P5D800_PARAD|nr:hypothetical protein PanWU01x14_088810 [Parasponia andersonii]
MKKLQHIHKGNPLKHPSSHRTLSPLPENMVVGLAGTVRCPSQKKLYNLDSCNLRKTSEGTR